MSPKNARTLGIRLDDATATDLDQFERETHIEGVSLARTALKCALAYYKLRGHISLPLYIVDASYLSQHAQPPTTSHVTSPAQPCASIADLESIIPKPPSPTALTAHTVALPSPPILATLLHSAMAAETTQSPPASSKPHQEVTYPKKKPRKSS
jgi:hypothetical protein